ncbi:alpha/beta fold hydrolase [Dactylosporangium aurantiacum]|uniref:Alpha/beta fold hydrolase n=1 Tax=Dactylosporangium aurantiacum TaxID=35754 RepID=A0A9Q9IDA0_9ACTN|nr:epoxide hydrolase [Dactylosporangium aurantiacum]MDG6102549.1 epoxide hydrolase [Dactylosporangium aurantiacum]UWZ53181.1 alpha/beta fold hydrolase [Dactylosporangium aurantiacum]
MIRSYTVDVPQTAIDDLHARLRDTLWPDELPGVGDSYGVPVDRVRALTEHWLERFDWRAVEARINRHPQFVTEIDGENIHFLHVRSPREDAVPLILTHGWPGSIIEYLDVIEPLSRDFHLVIPSLPGFGFSGPTRSRGWNRHRTARAWNELMRRLGYDRFGAVGNDAGSMIAPEQGRNAPDRVIGVHVTQLFSFPSGDPAEFAALDETGHAALAKLQWFYDNLMSFNILHSQQPQTLAFALADSPAGLLAWNAQLFGADLDADFILANVAVYWFTRTAASAIRFYYEDAHTDETVSGPTTVPTGLAMFAGDFQSIRPFAERDHSRIVRWRSYDPGLPRPEGRDAGGHYAAHQATDLLVNDIREFFAELR